MPAPSFELFPCINGASDLVIDVFCSQYFRLKEWTKFLGNVTVSAGGLNARGVLVVNGLLILFVDHVH